MGQGWRRVTEAVRQKVGADRGFKPTSNARNEAMFKEATDFAALIKVLEKDIRALEKNVEGNFANLRGILESPLPRVYEEGQDGAVPCEEGMRQIGSNVHFDSITEAAVQMRRRLEQEVISPLKHWMLSYRTAQERMAMLEKLRLEVDSRRRTVDGLRDRLDRISSTVERQRSINRLDPKQGMELDKTQSLLTHKDEKLQRTVDQYHSVEQTVFNSLFTLIRDTTVLRDYTRTALSIVQECYAMASASYEGQPAALEHTMQSGTAGNAPLQIGYDGQARSERAMSMRPTSERSAHTAMPPPIAAKMPVSPGMPAANIYVASGMDDAHDPHGYDQAALPQLQYSAAPGAGGFDAAGGQMQMQQAANPYAGYAQGVMQSPGRLYGQPTQTRQQQELAAGSGWNGQGY